MRALATNRTIVQLSVQDNQLGVPFAKEVAATLGTSTSLYALDVQYNELGVEGAVAICEALRGNRSLRELNLSANKLGGGGGAMAAALKGSAALKELELQYNSLSEARANPAPHPTSHGTRPPHAHARCAARRWRRRSCRWSPKGPRRATASSSCCDASPVPSPVSARGTASTAFARSGGRTM